MLSTMQGPPLYYTRVRLEARINLTRFIHPSPLYKIRRAHRVDQLFRSKTTRSGLHSKSSTANGIMPEAHFYHICQMQTFQNSRVAQIAKSLNLYITTPLSSSYTYECNIK